MINYNIKRERRGGAGSGFSFFGRVVGLGESSTAQQSVEEFRARQARTRLYYTECESSVASFHRRREWAWGRRAPFEEGEPF